MQSNHNNYIQLVSHAVSLIPFRYPPNTTRRYALLFSGFLVVLFILTYSKELRDGRKVDQLKEYSMNGQLTFISGTHLVPEIYSPKIKENDDICEQLSTKLYMLWTTTRIDIYNNMSSQIETELGKIASNNIHCVITGSQYFNSSFSSPITFRPDAPCDDKWAIITKKLHGSLHSLPSDYFLYRPDFVKVSLLARRFGIKVKLGVVISNEHQSASFSHEGCDRYLPATPLNLHYRQRLLWNQLTYLQGQLKVLKANNFDICILNCGDPKQEDLNTIQKWLVRENGRVLDGIFLCENVARSTDLKPIDQSTLIDTINALSIFSNLQANPEKIIKKTKFSGGSIIFVAGVEGVGHHAIYPIAMKYVSSQTRDAMRNYIILDAHSKAGHNHLVKTLKSIKTLGLHFLNPDLDAGDVYSFPFGAFRDCRYRTNGRSICNPDLYDLAKVGEEAGMNFIIILLERTFQANLIADSIHRHLSTTFEQAKVLVNSHLVLTSALELLDPKFIIKFNYLDMLVNPENSAKFLASTFKTGLNTNSYKNFVQVFQQNRKDYYHGNKTTWRMEIKERFWDYVQDMETLYYAIAF